jgi:hypothetical protein
MLGHAGHRLTSLLHLVPILAIVALVVIGNARDRRAGRDRDADLANEPSLDDIMDGAAPKRSQTSSDFCLAGEAPGRRPLLGPRTSSSPARIPGRRSRIEAQAVARTRALALSRWTRSRRLPARDRRSRRSCICLRGK